jgi:hypothetical protein
MHPTNPIAAPIETLDWIVGRWAGGRGDDRFEEWWAEPAGGTMVGMFRWLRGDAVRFYELLTVEPQDDGLVWRIKHFKPGLIGWEEKDAAVTLDLVRLGKGEAVFLMRGDPRWMVYRREPATNELVAYFESEASPHSQDDEFRYAQR